MFEFEELYFGQERNKADIQVYPKGSILIIRISFVQARRPISGTGKPFGKLGNWRSGS